MEKSISFWCFLLSSTSLLPCFHFQEEPKDTKGVCEATFCALSFFMLSFKFDFNLSIIKISDKYPELRYFTRLNVEDVLWK